MITTEEIYTSITMITVLYKTSPEINPAIINLFIITVSL